MLPQKSIVLPSVASLPCTDPCFLEAIDDLALVAGGLMMSVDAAMLAVPLPSDRWADDLPLTVWTQRLEASPALATTLIDTPMFTPAFDALCMAADALFARLEAWRWIDRDAPGLCLVTDGVDVILSTVRPEPEAGCGWLLDLARRNRGAVTARHPHAHGAWSLIKAEIRTVH